MYLEVLPDLNYMYVLFPFVRSRVFLFVRGKPP